MTFAPNLESLLLYPTTFTILLTQHWTPHYASSLPHIQEIRDEQLSVHSVTGNSSGIQTRIGFHLKVPQKCWSGLLGLNTGYRFSAHSLHSG